MIEFIRESAPSGQLPIVLTAGAGPCIDRLLDWLAESGARLDRQLHRHGAALLRGFDVPSVASFQRVPRRIWPDLAPYIQGNSPRSALTDRVYTSTEFPRSRSSRRARA